MTATEKKNYIDGLYRMFDTEILQTLIVRARVKIRRAINREEASPSPNSCRIEALEKESARLEELGELYPKTAEILAAAIESLKNYTVPQFA